MAANAELRHRDSGMIIDAARLTLAQEVQLAQRLEDKAKASVTIAGVWFALVQAVAGGVYQFAGALPAGEELDNRWLYGLAGLAALGGLHFLFALIFGFRTWSTYSEEDFGRESFEDMLDFERRKPESLRGAVLQSYIDQVEQRRMNNGTRASFVNLVQILALASMALALSELLLALAARLFG